MTNEQLTDIALSETSCRLYPSGTVLIAMYGGYKQIGRTGILQRPAAVNQAISAVVVDQRKADPKFLIQYLNHHVKSWRNVAASSRKDPNITRLDVEKFIVDLPPLLEQRKIAEILRTWDDAIAALLKTVELEMMRYAALVNQLIDPGNISSQGSHEVVRLSAVTEERTKRNSDERLVRTDVMGVSNRVGLFPMREQTIAGDISRYKVLPRKSFAYNPMRINVGSIAMSEEHSDVLVSPDYVLFACSEDQLIPEYLLHLMKSTWWSYQMNSSGSGSVRTRIYYKDLAALHISLPSLEEQSKICAVLDASQKLSTKSARHVELIETQKRGLMQQLLTGKIRVNVDEGN